MTHKPIKSGSEAETRIVDILNYGALNLAMGIGYRVGLFDVMDQFAAPVTLEEISDAAGASPRYVREWLGIMVTGGIVEFHPRSDNDPLYYLSRHFGERLTRRAGNSNLGVYFQEIPLLTLCAMEGVVDGFRTGDGIPYDRYPQFQAFMQELADAKHRTVLVERFLPSVDDGRLVGRLQSGIRVCDIGCGTGMALLLMARAYPKSAFVGFDTSEEALQTARASSVNQGLVNISFERLDVTRLEADDRYENRFDYVTAFDAIHDLTRPLDAVRGVRSILAPGGLFSMVDIAAETDLADNLEHPMAPFLYTVSLLHCMPVGLNDDGEGLGMMWGKAAAVEMLSKAGFRNVEVCEIPDDPFNTHFLCRQ